MWTRPIRLPYLDFSDVITILAMSTRKVYTCSLGYADHDTKLKMILVLARIVVWRSSWALADVRVADHVPDRAASTAVSTHAVNMMSLRRGFNRDVLRSYTSVKGSGSLNHCTQEVRLIHVFVQHHGPSHCTPVHCAQTAS